MSVQVAGQPANDSTNREEAATKALKAFFNIADAWDIDTEHQMKLLGSVPRSTYFKLKKEGGSISQDLFERVSYIIGIYKDLHILFPDPAVADAWIKKPNSAAIFNGRSALDRMLGGRVSDLYVVRRYLDSQRG
jgi:hypothetical protein